MYTFGPVPSRRLGRSLGINNIPPKKCTYSCVYCQVGRTLDMRIERGEFYEPDSILEEVEDKLDHASANGERVDYVTIVPDGEPTLDTNLGKLLEGLDSMDPRTAVITNSSLIWKPEVRAALYKADWVSLKVDAVNEKTWHSIDRPHGHLELERVLEGVAAFSEDFCGDLVTETMLVKGLNDTKNELTAIGKFIEKLNTSKSYISVPTRPPAEKWVSPPDERSLAVAYQILNELTEGVEYLISYEGEDFTSTDEAVSDLVKILAVHPMRESAVLEFLANEGKGRKELIKLLNDGNIRRAVFQDNVYYVRRF